MPANTPSQEAKMEAYNLGVSYSEWDREQLTQSAEFANDIAPDIRRLAGYEDFSGIGTYRDDGENDPDDLSYNEEELFEDFWAGYESMRE